MAKEMKKENASSNMAAIAGGGKRWTLIVAGLGFCALLLNLVNLLHPQTRVRDTLCFAVLGYHVLVLIITTWGWLAGRFSWRKYLVGMLCLAQWVGVGVLVYWAPLIRVSAVVEAAWNGDLAESSVQYCRRNGRAPTTIEELQTTSSSWTAPIEGCDYELSPGPGEHWVLALQCDLTFVEDNGGSIAWAIGSTDGCLLTRLK